MELSFVQPNDVLMKQIAAYVEAYVLDDEDLQPQQFVAALAGKTLVGFGRLRKHNDCDELCTLGVIEEHRGKGVGKALVNKIKKLAQQNLYLVCIIPDYFVPLGFSVIHEKIPAAMKRKHQRCTSEYVVEEEYCVMALNKNKK